MGTLVFVCPATREEVSTGIEMDLATLHQLELSKVYCPHCRQQHQMAGIPNWLAMGGTAREHVLRGCKRPRKSSLNGLENGLKKSPPEAVSFAGGCVFQATAERPISGLS